MAMPSKENRSPVRSRLVGFVWRQIRAVCGFSAAAIPLPPPSCKHVYVNILCAYKKAKKDATYTKVQHAITLFTSLKFSFRSIFNVGLLDCSPYWTFPPEIHHWTPLLWRTTEPSSWLPSANVIIRANNNNINNNNNNNNNYIKCPWMSDQCCRTISKHKVPCRS